MTSPELGKTPGDDIPEVSVIVPCFNQAHYVHGMLHSVSMATERLHEVILIDDGSTRASTDRHLSGLETASNQLLVMLRTENSGLAATRNRGVRHSRGKYVQFLDADDLLLPHSIDEKLNALEKSGADIAITDYIFCNAEQNSFWAPEKPTIDSKNFSFHGVAFYWERGLTIPIHCGLFDRELVLDNLFCEKMTAKEDWLFWLGIFLKAKNVKHLKRPGCVYRMHDSNMTRDGRKMALTWIDAIYQASEQFPQFDRKMQEEALKHLSDFYLSYFWQKEKSKFPISFFDNFLRG